MSNTNISYSSADVDALKDKIEHMGYLMEEQYRSFYNDMVAMSSQVDYLQQQVNNLTDIHLKSLQCIDDTQYAEMIASHFEITKMLEKPLQMSWKKVYRTLILSNFSWPELYNPTSGALFISNYVWTITKHYILYNSNTSCTLQQTNSFYYEVKLLAPPSLTLSFGVVLHKKYPVDKPIGEVKESVGLNHIGELTIPTSPKKRITNELKMGDVIGCGWNSSKRTLFFTLNGTVTIRLNSNCQRWTPAIHCESKEDFSVNFGKQPFQYNFLSE
ncbi:SPRY domain-containing protein 7 [Entamoeba marina]